MKQDTKKLVLIGGVALAGLYAYSTMGGEDYAGMGGGGGAPLLPSIVEAATGAETASPMIVNIPPMPMPVWDTEEVVDTSAKKVSTAPTYAPSMLPTYPLEYYKSGGISELAPGATQPQKLKSIMELQHYDDPFAYLFSGRTDKIERKKSEEVRPDIHKAASVRGHQLASIRFDPKKGGSGYTNRSGDAFTRLGQRSYSGARSAALSSSKKAQSKPGGAD